MKWFGKAKSCEYIHVQLLPDKALYCHVCGTQRVKTIRPHHHYCPGCGKPSGQREVWSDCAKCGEVSHNSPEAPFGLLPPYRPDSIKAR